MRSFIEHFLKVNFLYRVTAGMSLGMYVYHDYGSDIGIKGSTSGHESWFEGYRISA